MRIPAYHRPRTLEEAWQFKAEQPSSRFIAGGTDMLVRIREGSQRPPALVSLRNIPELHGIDFGERLTIGALTPVARIAEHEGIRRAFPALHQGSRLLGSLQVRNLATAGGNLCNASPCADLAPPLLVLEARLRVAGPKGRRELPLEDFFVAPGETRLDEGEIVAGIVVDRLPDGASCHYIKKTRVAMDISLVAAAVMLQMDGGRCVAARVAAGSVAPRPIRLPKTEAHLLGTAIDDAALAAARAEASQEVQPVSDKRATAQYRRDVVGVLVERAARRTLEHLEGDRA